MKQLHVRFLTIFAIFFLCSFFTSTLFAQVDLDNYISPSKLPYLKNSKHIQVSSHDTSGGNEDRLTIKTGDMATLMDVEGPGMITRIWITIDSRDPYFLRRILLRMYWDDEEEPSVEVPVGDFFGTGFQYEHYMSAFVGMSSGGYYSYFPMPFRKKARIEVVNQTGQEIYAFYYQINYQQFEQPLDDNVAYFHAQWRRDLRTDYDSNYVLLEAEGEGHFVGCNMNMQGIKGNLWYLEGDEMVYVDGEDYPSVYGTGTEDYFTGGWYFNRGVFDGDYHGLIIKDDSLARIAVYRFHIGDVIPFKNSLRFTIEHGHGNTEVADYSSTAYWYQMEPHKSFPEMLPAALRIPLRTIVPDDAINAQDCIFTDLDGEYEVMNMENYGPDWMNVDQTYFKFTQLNQGVTIHAPVMFPEMYNVTIYYTTGPEYGIIEILQGNKKVGEIDGYSSIVQPGETLKIEGLNSEKGGVPLRFVVKGKNEKSSGYALGIDAFQVVPVREFIPEWYVAGPFPNPRDENLVRLGLDTEYPPEVEDFDPKQTFYGVDSQKVSWELMNTPESGYFTLWNHFDPSELIVTYAVTYVWSPIPQQVPMLVGTDDGARVFLNGRQQYRFLEVRIAAPDQDYFDLHLDKGWNKIMVKIENNFGGYAFYARVIDPFNSLVFSADRKLPD